MTITRLRNCSIAVVSAALLLAGCNAGSEAPRANESKQPGGLLSALRPAPVVVPEGATLSLVLETSLSSETSRAGDRVVAKLAEGVRVGEKVVVPAGSEVRGRVTAAVPSGRARTAPASPSPSTRSSSTVKSTPSAQERSTSPPPIPTRKTP
jgi:hypothetical protein